MCFCKIQYWEHISRLPNCCIFAEFRTGNIFFVEFQTAQRRSWVLWFCVLIKIFLFLLYMKVLFSWFFHDKSLLYVWYINIWIQKHVTNCFHYTESFFSLSQDEPLLTQFSTAGRGWGVILAPPPFHIYFFAFLHNR